MRIQTTLIFLFVTWYLIGCNAINIPYDASSKMSDKEASALLVDLTLSQEASRTKPTSLEIKENSILWENEPMFFVTMKDVELLEKSQKYLVQLNFNGNVFQKNDWFIVYKTSNIDEAKRYIDVLTSLIASRNNPSRCGNTVTPVKNETPPANTGVQPQAN